MTTPWARFVSSSRILDVTVIAVTLGTLVPASVAGEPFETSVVRVLAIVAGLLLPLSDYGRDGAPIRYKAWVCSNPECGFNIRIDNGEITFGRTIGQSYK